MAKTKEKPQTKPQATTATAVPTHPPFPHGNVYTPPEVGEKLCQYAQGKAKKPLHIVLLLAIFSGIFLGASCIATSSMAALFQDPGMAKLITGIIFPFGLTMIIFTGTELFTGNTLMLIAVLEKRCSVASMLKNWAVVYTGNFIGCAGTAILYANTSKATMDGGSWAYYMIKTAVGKLSYTWMDAFVLGIFCNILVTVAVYMAISTASPTGKLVSATIPVSIFVMAGFEHSIANMFYLPVGLSLYGQNIVEAVHLESYNLDVMNTTYMFMANLVPVTLGNIVGGLSFAFMVWFCHKKGH